MTPSVDPTTRKISVIDGNAVQLNIAEEKLLLKEFGEAADDREITSDEIDKYYWRIYESHSCLFEDAFLLSHPVGKVLAKYGVSSYALRFDPRDPQIIAFFNVLGISAVFYGDGRISYQEKEMLRMDNLIMWLGKTDESPGFGNQHELDHQVSDRWLRIASRYSPAAVRKIFEHSQCFSPFGADVANHFFNGVSEERLTARIQETFGINPHCACQYDALKDLPIEALHGVFFDDQTVPNSLAQMGKSVLPIRIVDRARGSSVIVSPLGHVITAHHVFYDPETGKPRENIKLKYNDEMEFTVSEENLRYVSREGDLVILQIPELAQQKDLCFAQVRQTPISEGSELVDVGFPQTAMENIMKRFYTVGAVIAPHENPSENEQEDFAGLRKMGYNFERFIMSNCVNVHGASGGAIFDSDGRVVGINTAFADQAKIGLHSDLTSPGTDEKLRVVLQEIIATYHNG